MKNLTDPPNKSPNKTSASVCPDEVNRLEQQVNSSLFSFCFFFRILFFLAITGIGVVADLETKNRVFQEIGMPGMYRFIEEPELSGVYWLWEGVLGFQTSLNQGALFGMGQGQVFWLTLFSFIFLIGILVWMIHSAWKSWFLVVTLGLIVAGIIGNLYDRLGLHGLRWDGVNGEPVYAVRDWILVMLGSYPWPNFNIADSMLVCGAFLLAFHSFFVMDMKDTVAKNTDSPSCEQVIEKTKR
ncbi:MAG: signal peptidase II [Planctomycetaceae bacterium]|jgi:signal peptidase II|nr:signal peptidase II [Planctomycetaceae bacterium]